MDAEDARAAGAMDDVDGAEFVPDHLPTDLTDSVASPEPETPNLDASLRVPGGATDPMWYLIAEHMAPKGVGSTWRRGWIEGFVAAMGAARGIDAPAGVEDILRDTLDMRGIEE